MRHFELKSEIFCIQKFVMENVLDTLHFVALPELTNIFELLENLLFQCVTSSRNQKDFVSRNLLEIDFDTFQFAALPELAKQL